MSPPQTPEDPREDRPTNDGEAGAGIDQDALKDALTFELPDLELSPSISNGNGPQDSEQLEEIAEDMLHLLERVRSLEQSQESLLARLEESIHAQRETGREVGRVREELLGERKATAVLSLFTGLVQRMDSVRGMLKELDPGKDSRTVEQLTAIDDILALMLRGLGFDEFHPERGDAFDPYRMECVGYALGDPDVVLEVVQAGYEAGGAIARPAPVRIADPEKTEETTPR